MDVNDSKFLDSDFLDSAKTQLASLESRLSEINEEIAELETEHRTLESHVRALRRLLGSGVEHHLSVNMGITANTDITLTHTRRIRQRSPIDVAEEILSERNGEHMHYRELTEEVMSRGGELPEGSPDVALNVMMNRDSRFVRPFRRGYYALKKDHPNVKHSVGSRIRRRARVSQANDSD